MEERIGRCCFSTLFEDTRMRIVIALDDALLAEAQALAGVQVKSALVREAMIALMRRGGSNEPDAEAVPP